jgi:hypothetical protein
MDYWHILPDSGNYRRFLPTDPSNDEYFDLENGLRRGLGDFTRWAPLRVSLYCEEGKEQKPLGDFPGMGGTVPLKLSQRAVDALGPLMSDAVRLLPLVSDAGQFFIADVRVVDCLDHARSSVRRFDAGKIMRVVSSAFREEMLSNVHIFRISEEAVQAAHLEGLAFYEVPLAAP